MQWYTERCFLCSICVDGFLRCCIWLPLICYDLTDFLQLCVFWCFFFPIFFCFLPLFMWLPSIAPISRIPCNFATFHGSRIRSTFFLSHNLAFGRLYCFFLLLLFWTCFQLTLHSIFVSILWIPCKWQSGASWSTLLLEKMWARVQTKIHTAVVHFE